MISWLPWWLQIRFDRWHDNIHTLYQCQFPDFDIALWCKIEPMGKLEWRLHGNSQYYLYNFLWLYCYLKLLYYIFLSRNSSWLFSYLLSPCSFISRNIIISYSAPDNSNISSFFVCLFLLPIHLSGFYLLMVCFWCILWFLTLRCSFSLQFNFR